MSDSEPVRIGIDIGGTFTDFVLEAGSARHTLKVLTTPDAPERAVFDGLSAVTSEAGVAPSDVTVIIHGTTLATNALIERGGARTALITTEGFRDVIEMGTESRFEQYDLDMVKPDPLVARRDRLTVRERIGADGEVLVPLDEEALAALAPVLVGRGIESIAIAFMHSFAHPAHERRAAEILSGLLPGVAISLSSEVSPEIREYERFTTTCANAYVQPMLGRYLGRLERGLKERDYACPLFLMSSGGGMTEVETARRFPVRLIESGPAGGAILAADIARRNGHDRVVSFDMGGTTAKLCLIDDGAPQTTRNFEVARAYRFKPGSGLPLRIPVVEMVEIGAGGGSVARVDSLKRITVGPDSAGAEPGPACYGRGGAAATVTDANVCLGRIAPQEFAGGRLPLVAEYASNTLERDVGAVLGFDLTAAAAGVVEIVDENMANAAREHAVERGKTLAGRTLIALGGCAPLHAARLAEKLGIDRIVVPASAGVGSALGFLRAPIAYEVARTAYQRLTTFASVPVNRALDAMSREAHAIVARAAGNAPRTERRVAYMRYVGQGHEIPVVVPLRPLKDADGADLRAAYDAAYAAKYGRLMAGVDVEVMSWTVAVSVGGPQGERAAEAAVADVDAGNEKRRLFDMASDGFADAAVHRRDTLAPGSRVPGPAVITEDETTIVVPASFVATVNSLGDVVLKRVAEGAGWAAA